jgi:hypothetical protein
MGHQRYTQAFLNVGFYLLVYCSLNYHPTFVVGGFGRLLAFLVFASLLLFVVVHSAAIRRVAVAFFEALRLPLFCLLVDPGCIERPLTATAVPKKATLSPLFQRSPPISWF